MGVAVGPLSVQRLAGRVDIMDAEGHVVAILPYMQDDPNADRLVQCTNALENLDPEALPEVITALEQAADGDCPRGYVRLIAIRALAKLR